jgi:addiction module HigA family antidote
MPKTSRTPPQHPGIYVRNTVLPKDMSVTDAAKHLGIGRPALSNFLNGNSALSPEMAIRLEKTFGADRKKLFDMQVAYDQQQRLSDEKTVTVRAFVPHFLTVKARQIEQWADNQIDARSHFSVLLRKLVHSTGIDLQRVDFPGYDNAQRTGPDGLVEAGSATPWIPEGKSYWEFGTNKDVQRKANDDYAVRLSIDPAERVNSTLVFVTPRNWKGKTKWEKDKNKLGEWKSVRVFDASDLEQWLEQSIPTQIWFAEQIALPTSGYETLEQAWHRWSNASEPKLAPEIFAPSIIAHLDTFKKWLSKPSEKPFVVAADSRDEAVAFLACLFNNEELHQFRDRAAIFTSSATLRKLFTSSVRFIPIVYSRETERELIHAPAGLHCIVFRPRNAVDTKADIFLDLLSNEAFEKALRVMEIEEERTNRLAVESGRSPTILRRRLSKNKAIRTPVWADDNDKAKALVPIGLAGIWHVESEADRELVSYLADEDHKEIENNIARLLQIEDSPVWSVGRYRGVVSKIDVLFAVARMVTKDDIERFFLSAEYVLSEFDPALELPEEDRWASALYGKNREHSGALREGICETLVILSVHGNNLLQERLGVDIAGRVARLIRKLLTPMTLENILSHERDLPRYAEAAPNEFLKIIEEDLQNDSPAILGILKPVNSGIFLASPPRTGLLWALECLAWDPKNLPRVAKILAQLSKSEINDNWANKPNASLQAIFRSWMPQTAASIEERMMVLELLVQCFPNIGWDICLKQVKPGPRFGNSSYRPRWRNDASGAGQVVTRKERYDFTRRTLNLLIAWSPHNEMTLGDLVESLQTMPEEVQNKVWDLIDEWSQAADESAKSMLRERIRRFAFTRRSNRNLNVAEVMQDRAREAYDRLEPSNPVIRHAWLFAEHWVQESISDIEEDFDYRKHRERIDKLRREAMLEIWIALGFDGVRDLLIRSGAPYIVGHYLATCITGEKPRLEFIRHGLSLDGDLRNKAEDCLRGYLLNMEENARTEMLKKASKGLSAEDSKRLLICAPFQTSTWRLLEGYNKEIRVGYWKAVVPSWDQYSPAEITEIIDRLLEVRRPRAAFHSARMNFNDIETSRLKRLLRDVATVNAEPLEHFKLDRYLISEALNSLDGRAGVSPEEMAQLEFLYIHILDDSKHGIPNLENQIVQSPAFFVRVVAFAYKRRDDGEDPPEWKFTNPEQQEAVALSSHRLLEQIQKIPGINENGQIEAARLIEWLTEVRSLCDKYARAVIGDHILGQLLAKAPKDEEGIWPCQPVCQAMEVIASPEIAKGFQIGVYNSRGVHRWDEEGRQERELAAKYRDWADRLRFNYPYVGGVLDDIAQTYESEANWNASEGKIRKRLEL